MRKFTLLGLYVGSLTLAALTGDVIRRARAYEPGATAASVVRIDPMTDEVFINWRLVEQTARGRGPAAEMPVMIAAAKIMIAVRDKTWKPMPR